MDTTNELFRLIEWNTVQARIQLSHQSQFPKRRQIWWVNLGQNVGVEMNGKHQAFERPVLVIQAFNMSSFLVAPLTSKLGLHRFLIKIEHLGENKSVNISQLRTLSGKRFTRKISDMSEIDFERIVTSIQELILLIKTEAPQNGASSNSNEME